MPSVTGRIKEIHQPRGGYLKLSDFDVSLIEDAYVPIGIYRNENIHSSLIGTTVDYLTRIQMGTTVYDAFEGPILGARFRKAAIDYEDSFEVLFEYLDGIHGLDDQSIINACKAATFDSWFRAPMFARNSKQHTDINPDDYTIRNIQILVGRCVSFFEKYGPVTQSGFDFNPPDKDDQKWWRMMKEGGSYGGYTKTVDAGEGDFLTKNTMWDLKVRKSKPNSKHTLQLLMYWIMGQHSGQEIYSDITKIGMFNPRFDMVYLLDVNRIPDSTIQLIEEEIICYE